MHKKLTIWVPTKNRPDFLIRLFEYYKKTKFEGYLFIGDSSEGEKKEINEQTIKKYEKYLNIYYCKFPNMPTGHVSSKLVPQIETEFSSLLCDDDVIMTPSINPCIEYLLQNDTASGANGKSLLFETETNKAFGNILRTSTYNLAKISNSNGKDRLKNIFF